MGLLAQPLRCWGSLVGQIQAPQAQPTPAMCSWALSGVTGAKYGPQQGLLPKDRAEQVALRCPAAHGRDPTLAVSRGCAWLQPDDPH